jgi:hypothetical protein
MIRKDLDPDSPRPVLETSFLVCETPKPLEQDHGIKPQLGQILVLEKPRLQIA